MRRTSFRGRNVRPRVPTKWTGNGLLVEETVAAAAQAETEVIGLADYVGGLTVGNVEAGACTLLRIRGQLSVRATVVGGIGLFALIRLGSNEVAQSLLTQNQITSGDMLWSYQVGIPVDTVHVYDIDVKSKRKLEDDRIVFVRRAVAQSVTLFWNFRALMRSHG